MPLTIITQKELKSRGYMTLGDVIRYLAMNQVTNDAFSVQDGRTSANLRGFGTEATRVLLNGEPLPYFALDQINGAAVDLRLVPITAIERIEILPAANGVDDGSGSITGSINIILLENFNQVSGELWQSVTDEGAAETLLSFRNGKRSNNRGYDYTIAWYHRDALHASDRAFSSTSDHRTRGGSDLRSRFSSPPTIENLSLTPSLFADPACPTERVTSTTTGTACVINLNTLLDLSPDDERINLGLGADWSFNNGLRFEFDLAFTDGKTSFRQIPPAIFGDTLTFGTVFYRPLDTGTPLVVIKDRVTHISSRTSGKVATWDWKAGLVYGRSTASRTHNNGLLLDRFLDALQGNGGINGNRTYNPFGAEPQNNGALVDFLTTNWNEYAEWKEVKLFGEFTTEIFNLPGGSARLGFGLETATESLQQQPSPAAVNFRIAGSGRVIQVDEERDRNAAWITAWFPFHNRWSANVGIRSDDYEDTNETSTADIGVVYQATDEVQVRTGYSQGFRVPTLAETHSRIAPGNTTLQPGFSNTALEPEESETFYLGITWRSITIPGLIVSIDMWKTRYANRVTSQLVTPSALPSLMLVNSGTTVAQAADLNARYEVETTIGQFTFQTQQAFLERLTDTQGTLLIEQSETLPDYRSTYMVDWNRDRHGATFSLFYTSDYDTPNGTVTSIGREMVDAWYTVDLQYRIKTNALNGGTFRVGCRNCTDEDPPFSNNSIFGFDSTYHDPRGLQLYVSWEQVF
ncbi:MAG: TonB-dependent receptor [Gammaproteobacteria bacterium]